ncbi:mechanosensitive ion channel [Ottowia sp.]|uniref:mechanosensitive ion channel n=2 Tax=Ottowia sp. TaxID=1898956 RepID=UPI002B556B23|nr:mechanosensitive ion channel [Ottowia sp.]HOB65165.1 mechanosensitive ion channel [Ottowia sp.]HQD46634.1 mechanosensitive ion channel [Ottowia sp.]
MSEWNTMWASLQTSMGVHIPQVLGALAIFIIGWFVAALVKAGARKGLGLLKLNQRFAGTTGQRVDLEGVIALTLFWVVMLLTLAAMFNALDLSLVSGSFAALTTQLFEYAPRLLGAVLLALLAWLVATLVRGVTQKVLDRTSLDEKLSEHANISPISESLSNALFWLVILLFVPAILGALQMEGLLSPLREMTTKALDILPNIVAALVIGGVGWIVATVLRNLTTNLLRSAGFDQIGNKAGLAGTVQLSGLAGLLVFIVVFVPALIAALDALRIEAISRPATEMLGMLMDAVPRIIAAGLILLITWLVGSFATRLLASLLANVGFDTLPAKLGLQHAFARTPPSTLIGRIALVFAMLFAIVEAGNQLGFARFSDMIMTFIEFAGDVLLGSVILIIGFMLANVAHEAIARASGNGTALANVARFAILGIVLAMGLRAMGIADDIVNLAFGLTLGAIAVAVALAFGLGGREAAGRLASRWVDRLCRRDPSVPPATPPSAPTDPAAPPRNDLP